MILWCEEPEQHLINTKTTEYTQIEVKNINVLWPGKLSDKYEVVCGWGNGLWSSYVKWRYESMHLFCKRSPSLPVSRRKLHNRED